MTSSSVKNITVVNRNGDEFEMTVSAALQSEILKRMLEDDCISDKIPLSDVNTKTLVKVIEYCEKYADQEASKVGGGAAGEAELKAWDGEFVNVDMDLLFNITVAANYLEVKGLLDLTCQTVADLMKGKSPEQLRQMFSLENDFTPEEEEQLREESRWAFD